MSDVFFITASVCIVILTILLSILLIKTIKSLDDVNIIVERTRNVTENMSKAVGVVASASAILSPFAGITKKFLKKRR